VSRCRALPRKFLQPPRAAAVISQLKKNRDMAGGDHFGILQWSALLWIGNLDEQF
jgi:hypothetical protein